MSLNQPARPARAGTRSALVVVLVVGAALLGLVGCRSHAWSSSAASPVAEPATNRSPDRLRGESPGRLTGQVQGNRDHALGVADGEVPAGVTVFDEEYPAVANLDPALLRALRQAATHAGSDGVELYVNSGWRSPAYQARLLDEAVSKYGSEEEAARWVARPDRSAHVSGDAIDIGPSEATAWLSEHGSEYGLCQIYSDEPWHYELRPEAVDHGCPVRYADPTHDPRMQQ